MYAGRIMEEQPTAALFAGPLHPYTAGLLEARPTLDVRHERLAVIPGRPPTPVDAPPGCPFYPRCSFAEAACADAMPPLRPLAPGAFSACRRTEAIRDELRPKEPAGRG